MEAAILSEANNPLEISNVERHELESFEIRVRVESPDV